jgi:hypothetical protein
LKDEGNKVFIKENYINSLKENLQKNSQKLVENIKEALNFNYYNEVDLVDFSFFTYPFVLSVTMFSMDRESNEVFYEGKDNSIFAGSYELIGDIEYYNLLDKDSNKFWEFYEQIADEISKAETQAFMEWFVACWNKANAQTLKLPAYVRFDDDDKSFDLHNNKWISDEEKWLMSDIKANHYLKVSQIAGNQESYRVSVDFDGNIILLTKQKIQRGHLHKVFHVVNGNINEIRLPSVLLPFSYAQPLEENWLLVSARTDEEEGYLRNATLFDVHGNVLKTFEFDDAIQDVQTTKDSAIWVSYFDENMGSGLRCYDKQGLKTFDYADFVFQTGRKVPFIDDCYALNVTSEGTHIYYYSDFPLVTLNKTGYKIFRNVPIQGSHAFAILNDLVLFSHGYDHKAVVFLYSLMDNKRRTFRTVNQDGEELKYDYAVGRRNKLFLVKGNDVYIIKMEDEKFVK